MLNWKRMTRRPGRSGGAISAMKRGAATVATPMPTPPRKRAKLSDQKSLAKPLPSADTSATPCWVGLSPQRTWMICSAPEMTIVSKPKRKPARAEVSDQRRKRAGMGGKIVDSRLKGGGSLGLSRPQAKAGVLTHCDSDVAGIESFMVHWWAVSSSCQNSANRRLSSSMSSSGTGR